MAAVGASTDADACLGPRPHEGGRFLAAWAHAHMQLFIRHRVCPVPLPYLREDSGGLFSLAHTDRQCSSLRLTDLLTHVVQFTTAVCTNEASRLHTQYAAPQQALLSVTTKEPGQRTDGRRSDSRGGAVHSSMQLANGTNHRPAHTLQADAGLKLAQPFCVLPHPPAGSSAPTRRWRGPASGRAKH